MTAPIGTVEGTVGDRQYKLGVDATKQGAFGELLRRHRISAGLTQQDLAERAQMSLAAVGKLERGARERPYRATVALLADALSLSPNDRVELERAANRGANAESKPAPDLRTAISLPVHFSSFVGREDDLENVGKLLAAYRIVTLVSAGGVGKTRLAIHAAEQFINGNSLVDHLDGVWFVDLAPLTDDTMLLTVLASSIGLDARQSMDGLIAYLRSQTFLLILDNCEHLLDPVALLAKALLTGCPGGRILATSRQALSLEGERVYRVPPLQELDAIRLFKDRAEAVDSRFELTDSVGLVVADICRRVDGIALAIELAAARTNAFSPEIIAEQIGEHLSLLAVGTRTALPRHQTMRALFDWSYDLLDDRERALFRSLSIFAGGFTLDLVCALYTDRDEKRGTPAILASLVDKSLVQCDLHLGPRYRLLEPARQYAREKLLERGEYDAAARSHALAFLAVALDVDSRLQLIPDHEWDRYVVRERDNFHAAFEWALAPQGGDPVLGRRLAASAAATWNGFGSGEVRKWIRAALESCEATPRDIQAKLAVSEARVAIHFDPNSEARVEACRHALALQAPDDLRAVSTAQYYLGLTFLSMGDYDKAAGTLREARALARSAGAQIEYTTVSTALGAALAFAGDFHEARKMIAESLQRSEAAGSDRGAAAARIELAEVEFAAGHVEEALRLNEQAVEFFQSHSSPIRLPIAYCNSSAYLIALDSYEEARSRAHEALRHARAMGNVNATLWALQHLAVIAVLSDERGQDRTTLQRAAGILGYVDEATRQRAKSRYHTEKHGYDKALVTLREVFSEDQLASLLAAGKAWSEQQAIAEATTL